MFGLLLPEPDCPAFQWPAWFGPQAADPAMPLLLCVSVYAGQVSTLFTPNWSRGLLPRCLRQTKLPCERLRWPSCCGRSMCTHMALMHSPCCLLWIDLSVTCVSSHCLLFSATQPMSQSWTMSQAGALWTTGSQS
jgi:hypothetical protein